MNLRSETRLSSRTVVPTLYRYGWRGVRQHGNHLILEKTGRDELLSVPLSDDLAPATVDRLLEAAGIPRGEFFDQLGEPIMGLPTRANIRRVHPMVRELLTP